MRPAALAAASPLVALTGGLVLAQDRAPAPRGKSREYREAWRAIAAMAKEKPPSRASGTVMDGRVQDPAELPAKGFGYRLAAPARKTHFGTDEMVYGLTELAAFLQERRPGSPWLSVGDIAGPEGGRLSPHINHQDGQDVDLAFLYCTAKGEPADRGWVKCDAQGRTKQAAISFDAARNFEMLAFWLESPFFGGCEWILVYEPLEKLIVGYGRDLQAKAAAKSPQKAEAIEKVTDELEKLMRQPESSPHDDHFHIRLRRKG